jgi:hypothetical protein
MLSVAKDLRFLDSALYQDVEDPSLRYRMTSSLTMTSLLRLTTR